jgi:hypothetical protein
LRDWIPPENGVLRVRRNHLLLFVATLFGIGLCVCGKAEAQCPALPNTITNGQVADATQVMGNDSALLACLNNGEFVPNVTSDLVVSGDVIGLAPTTVTAGSYTSGNFTVDANGRITAASSGPGTGNSGHVLPYLDGNNNWSGTQTFGTVIGTILTATGTSHTLSASECGTTILFTNSAAITVTTLASLPAGCAIALEQGGVGQITIVAGSGATQHSAHGYTKTYGQYAILGLFVDTNAGSSAADFIISGDGA